MISAADYHNVRTWLGGCQRPLLVTHRRPDGDALGALAGMTLALRSLQLDPMPALYEPLPPRYALLQDTVLWRRWDQEQAALTAACDALVILDTCAFAQLDPVAAFLPHAPRTLVIDHHPTRDPIAKRPGDLCLFDDTAGAVCLLIAEWIKTVGLPLTPPLATALLVGLGTDCGWFRFANTDARMLRTAAELVDAGAPSAAIYREIYEQDPLSKLRLIARMLQNLELHAGGKLAVMTLRPADYAATGADRTMTEDLVNEAGRLAGIEATLLFTEETDGRVRVNFRSKQSLDVAALASRFGGGGHMRAAGARPKGPWDEVVPRIIAATIAALGA
jgi:bifunctional oligoribonuclease and PAP phosphatase NrnA